MADDDDDGILTVTEVRNAPPREKRYSIADRDVPGMRLVVYPSGKKTYVIIPRVNGKKVTFTIGNADPSLLTLADARRRAEDHPPQDRQRRGPARGETRSHQGGGRNRRVRGAAVHRGLRQAPY